MQASILRRSRTILVGVFVSAAWMLAAFLGARPDTASAACNAIPAAVETDFYVSVDNPAAPTTISGKVDRRTVVPGERVSVAVNACAGAPGFEQAKLGTYRLALEFRDFAGGAAVAIPTTTLVSPQFAANCPGAVCESVSFEFPVTIDATTRPQGMAGPVSVSILDGAQVVARVDRLYLPTNTCPDPASDIAEDTVFRHLIALPAPNDFEPTPATGTESDKTMIAALDDEENLLIPFSFADELQSTDAPVATLLSGFTEIDAEPGPPSTHPAKLRERLGQQPNRDGLVRVFTLDGKPLPPLRKVTDDGGIYGLVDAESSVIRLQCSTLVGTPPRRMCDLKARAPYPGGPVVLTYRSKKGIRTPVPLLGLRTSEDTIAYARDEEYENVDLDGDNRKGLTPEIIEAKVGTPRLAGIPVAARPANNFFEPVLEVGKGHVAFLQPRMDASGSFIERHTLRIFRNGGTAVGPTPDVSDAPAIGGSPIALSTAAGAPPASATRAFYLAPGGNHDELAAVRLSAGNAVSGTMAATNVATAGGVAAHLVPERVVGDKNGDGDDFDSIAYYYGVRTNGSACSVPLTIRNAATGAAESAAATSIAISDRVIVAAVSEHDHFGRALNGDGDATDDIVHVWNVVDVAATCDGGAVVTGENLEYAADVIAAWSARAVWVAPEHAQRTGLARCQPTTPAQGCDLNADGDSNDRVLMSSIGTGTTLKIVSSEVATEDFELGAPSAFGLIAIRVPEAGQRQNLNDASGDIDWNDTVLHTYRPDCWNKARNAQWSAIPCTFGSCDPRHPYRVDGDSVWFLTDQRQPGPIALAKIDADDCGIIFPPIVPNTRPPFLIKIQPWWPLLRLAFAGEDVLMLAAGENAASRSENPLLVAGDVDGDGVFDPFDNCTERPNADRLDADEDGIGDRYCDPTPAACPPEPRSDCLGDDPTPSPTGLCFQRSNDELEFAWSWKSGTHARAFDPGDPIRGRPHYSLCVYPKNDRAKPPVAAAALPWPECGEPPCWMGDRARGFALRGDRKLPRNLETLILPGERSDQPVLYAKGTVPLRGLRAFAQDQPATVQLIARAGGAVVGCWSSTHRPAQTLAQCPAPAIHARPAVAPAPTKAPPRS